MDFPTAIRTCFNKYVDFTGRAARSEFWYFVLFAILGNIAMGLFDRVIGMAILGTLFGLAILLPGIAVSVRRLHDLGRSGWWYLLVFIPVIGWLVLLFWYVQPGTSGANEYGPDPLASAETPAQ
ncbi:DUF805 domain-containing protein [Alkalilacustris brevis]|uniref:DUF805 domain-containing protein n=1 Tax=Alkalilacustris brevis TaxID=2026338 RepID=UPI000E0D2744|nr:DUF805 domain-containing protein [Alkalilacustris brevis]